METLCLQA